MKMKVMPIIGTRPEGIKMAPLIKKIKADPELSCVFVNMAQHREMLDQVLDLFEIQADYDLNIMRPNQALMDTLTTMMNGLNEIVIKEKPDVILIHGDTLTTLAGALVAFFNQVKLGHVEAGLRTYDLSSPFPEEGNRQVAGRYADLHFAATLKNLESLKNEAVLPENIFVVGNTVIDALLEVADRPFTFEKILAAFINKFPKFILLTTHRRENLHALKDVYRALNQVIEEHPDVGVVFPAHKNPVVREQIKQHLKESGNILLVDPLDYETFVHLMKKAYFILTDSGGIQEEAPALGKPVLVARENTERPEGIAAGTLKLCGTSYNTVYADIKALLTNTKMYARMSEAKNPYGVGDTSEQIVKILKEKFIGVPSLDTIGK